MCEEPMMGVCFAVERWAIQPSAIPKHPDSSKLESVSLKAASDKKMETKTKKSEDGADDEEEGEEEDEEAVQATDATAADCYGPVSGQLIAAMKDACRHAFQARPQRLMAAMYTCEIMATSEVLGMQVRIPATQSVFLLNLVSISQWFLSKLNFLKFFCVKLFLSSEFCFFVCGPS